MQEVGPVLWGLPAVLPQWRHLVDLGFELVDSAVLIAALARVRLTTMPRWEPSSRLLETERWVNSVPLESERSPGDQAWRRELTALAMGLGSRLIAEAANVTALPVQVAISLQSGPGGFPDPELDFATGAMHTYCLREAQDDLASRLEGFTQPVMTMTSQPVDR